jgi:hypothetical protein
MTERQKRKGFKVGQLVRVDYKPYGGVQQSRGEPQVFKTLKYEAIAIILKRVRRRSNLYHIKVLKEIRDDLKTDIFYSIDEQWHKNFLFPL